MVLFANSAQLRCDISAAGGLSTTLDVAGSVAVSIDGVTSSEVSAADDEITRLALKTCR